MENPIVDTIRDYTVTYNDYLAKANIIETDVESKSNMYFAAFAPVVSEEDADRIGEVFVAVDELLDELFIQMELFKDSFDSFNDMNDEFNQIATETTDLSALGQDFLQEHEDLQVIIDKINALFDSFEQYSPIIDATISTLQEKYPDTYAEYLASLESTENAVGEPIEDSEQAISSAEQIFDNLNGKKPEAMFVENAITAKFAEAMQPTTVLTPSDKDSFTEAIAVLTSMKNDVYNRFHALEITYGKADIIVQHMAQINNMLHEIESLLKIFSDAVNCPTEWEPVNRAQQEVYRYEALQNDKKVIDDMLQIVEQKLKDGSEHAAGARPLHTEINVDELEDYQALNGMIESLCCDIEEFFDHVECNENLRSWVVNRFNDIIYHAGNYKRAIENITASTSINGGAWPYAVYGNEGMGGDIVGNELRECNLAAREIKSVIHKTHKRY